MALSRFEGYKNRRRQAIRCKKESASMTLTNTKNLPEQSTFNETWVLIKGWRRFKLTLERKMLSPSDNFETTKNN